MIHSNRQVREESQCELTPIRKSILSRPVTTFTSVPIKLVKYHISKPISSRRKFIENIQKSAIICYKCKKLKPSTFLKESKVCSNKICDCSQQVHSVKIKKSSKGKFLKPKSDDFEYLPFYAEGKSIQSDPSKIKRLCSEYEGQKYLSEVRESVCKIEMKFEQSPKYKYLLFKGNNSDVVKEAIIRREGWTEGYYSITCTLNFIWHPLSNGIKFDRLKSFLPTQIVNHLEFHSALSNKANLYKNLQKYCKKENISISSLVPQTFIFEKRLQNYPKSLENFVKVFNEKKGKNFWIVKPTNFNRGRGIQLFGLIEKFQEISSSFEEGQNFIVQRYIDAPLLFKNRKFDIRMWVLVSHENLIYVFPQGYLRTSSEVYSNSELDNKYMHLTNNAIQKTGNFYGKYENGNQVSFPDFEAYLTTLEKSKTFSDILKDIYRLIEISFKSVQDKLNPRNRNFCFEIFGYDFILDSHCKPWLIEVNTNPCLELSSPLLAQLIPRMIEDALELTLDKIFPSAKKQRLETPEVVDLPLTNLWHCLSKT